MTAPATAGTHSGQWRLKSPSGLFGPTLSVSIIVTGGGPPPAPAGCTGTPSIASFTASANNVAPGAAVTLNWGLVSNADTAEIDQGIGGVETPGSRTVNPTTATTYTLTARCGGNAKTAQVTVTVVALPPIVLLPSTSQVLAQSSIPAGATGSAYATCPSGSVVTGGGYASSGSLDVYNSTTDGNGWHVYAKNNSGASAPLNAYAICLVNTSGTTSQVLVQVTVPAGGTNSGTATCPSGSVVAGGGFALNTGEEVYTQSKSGNGWQVYGYNSSGAGLLLNVYAICLSGTSALTTQAPVVQVSVPAGSNGSATANCSSGIVTAGGFASSSGLGTKVYTHMKTSGQGWQVYLQNRYWVKPTGKRLCHLRNILNDSEKHKTIYV